MFPPLLHWQPNMARALLRYRTDRLDAAHANAKSHNPPYRYSSILMTQVGTATRTQ
jgi:hypothetical protein